MASNALVWPNTQTAISSHVQVPYKFVHLGEVYSYLDDELDQDIDIIDAKAENLNYHDIANEALNEYDSVAMFVRPDNVEDANETARMIKRVSPKTDIIAYGDLTVYLPTVFQQNDQLSQNFDGITVPGDQEESIAQLFKYQEGNVNQEDISGLWFTNEDESNPSLEPVQRVDPENWGFPDLDVLPLEDYEEMKEGHGGDEISFTISRGCPFGCDFCDAPKYYGAEDRRRPIDDVIRFLDEATEYTDRFKFFSPNIVLDRDYVRDLSDRISEEDLNIDWTATARIDLLDDEDLIQTMADSGCFKIAMGVETLDPDLQRNLDKEYPEEKLERVVSYMHDNNMIPKALIMLGVPGESRESVKYTFDTLNEMDAVVRPTSFTPYQNMTPEMSLDEISDYDKRTYVQDRDGLSEKEYFRLLYDPENYEEILDESP